MGKKILKVFLAIIVLLALCIVIFLNIPKANVQSKTTDISITADAIFDEFNKNENASNRKFIGKVVEVSGVIDELDTDKNGSSVLLLASKDDFNGVLCTLDGKPNTPLNIGQTVTVKGVCTGKLSDVVINKGLLVQ